MHIFDNEDFKLVRRDVDYMDERLRNAEQLIKQSNVVIDKLTRNVLHLADEILSLKMMIANQHSSLVRYPSPVVITPTLDKTTIT